MLCACRLRSDMLVACALQKTLKRNKTSRNFIFVTLAYQKLAERPVRATLIPSKIKKTNGDLASLCPIGVLHLFISCHCSPFSAIPISIAITDITERRQFQRLSVVGGPSGPKRCGW